MDTVMVKRPHSGVIQKVTNPWLFLRGSELLQKRELANATVNTISTLMLASRRAEANSFALCLHHSNYKTQINIWHIMFRNIV